MVPFSASEFRDLVERLRETIGGCEDLEWTEEELAACGLTPRLYWQISALNDSLVIARTAALPATPLLCEIDGDLGVD